MINIISNKESCVMIMLDPQEMIDVLTCERADELVVLLAVNHEDEYITIRTGTGRELMIPFCYFEPSGNGTVPDFTHPSIDDWGNTITFGKYEAAVDCLLSPDSII